MLEVEVQAMKTENSCFQLHPSASDLFLPNKNPHSLALQRFNHTCPSSSEYLAWTRFPKTKDNGITPLQSPEESIPRLP